jgi:hypothetical protein
MSEVKEFLTWAETMIATPIKQRKIWVEKIIAGIRSYREPKTKNPDMESQKKYLSDMLENEDDVELIGFAVNSSYIKVDSPHEEELGALFIHPFGTPQLLYKHKKLPMLLIVGPGIRLDESILEEVSGNQKIPTRGITG